MFYIFLIQNQQHNIKNALPYFMRNPSFKRAVLRSDDLPQTRNSTMTTTVLSTGTYLLQEHEHKQEHKHKT